MDMKKEEFFKQFEGIRPYNYKSEVLNIAKECVDAHLDEMIDYITEGWVREGETIEEVRPIIGSLLYYNGELPNLVVNPTAAEGKEEQYRMALVREVYGLMCDKANEFSVTAYTEEDDEAQYYLFENLYLISQLHSSDRERCPYEVDAAIRTLVMMEIGDDVEEYIAAKLKKMRL